MVSQKSLARQREVHLRRIIELDPEPSAGEVRAWLSVLQGQWITRSDARRKEGYEYYKGQWRTPQEIEILEEPRKHEQAETDWRCG